MNKEEIARPRNLSHSAQKWLFLATSKARQEKFVRVQNTFEREMRKAQKRHEKKFLK